MRLVGATAFPMVMAAGATGDPGDAYTIAAAAATEGRAVGIHVNFAPDADVNNNPANPIINTRSFGEDPRAVSRDRKSTRLNSSHSQISYAVFCLKKKTKIIIDTTDTST